ncbi:MAG: hypothetical protein HY291_03920 [Planctomycetes bacterium]|nr:hypothetical protein [Planctomycetota bacterium]
MRDSSEELKTAKAPRVELLEFIPWLSWRLGGSTFSPYRFPKSSRENRVSPEPNLTPAPSTFGAALDRAARAYHRHPRAAGLTLEQTEARYPINTEFSRGARISPQELRAIGEDSKNDAAHHFETRESRISIPSFRRRIYEGLARAWRTDRESIDTNNKFFSRMGTPDVSRRGREAVRKSQSAFTSQETAASIGFLACSFPKR